MIGKKLRDEQEEKHRKEMNDLHSKLLNMEADLRESEVQLEIANRSKRNLQKEIERLEGAVSQSQRHYDGITSSISTECGNNINEADDLCGIRSDERVRETTAFEIRSVQGLIGR